MQHAVGQKIGKSHASLSILHAHDGGFHTIFLRKAKASNSHALAFVHILLIKCGDSPCMVWALPWTSLPPWMLVVFPFNTIAFWGAATFGIGFPCQLLAKLFLPLLLLNNCTISGHGASHCISPLTWFRSLQSFWASCPVSRLLWGLSVPTFSKQFRDPRFYMLNQGSQLSLAISGACGAYHKSVGAILDTLCLDWCIM